MFRDFLRVVGASEIGDDPRFATAGARAMHRAELRAEVEPRLREFTAADLIQRLNAQGVPSGPILTIDQVFADPQVAHLEMAQPVQSERYGELRLVRLPVRLSRTPTSLRRAAPDPGGDTAEVLSEHGVSAQDMAALEENGAIRVREGSRARQ
jgi:crotonobetainyl-CoA:carnitine CoA-transferase CaiB-like acyl-CoA transferase